MKSETARHHRISITVITSNEPHLTTNHLVCEVDDHGAELTDIEMFDIAITRSIRQRYGSRYVWSRHYGELGAVQGLGIIGTPTESGRGINVLMETCVDARFI